LRLRRRVRRAGRARRLPQGVRGGEGARQVRGLRLAQRPGLLRLAGQRGAGDDREVAEPRLRRGRGGETGGNPPAFRRQSGGLVAQPCVISYEIPRIPCLDCAPDGAPAQARPEGAEMATFSATTLDRKAIAKQTARMMLEIKALHFNAEKPFIFTSGWASPVYVDCRKIISFPRLRNALMDFAAQTIVTEIGYESLDCIAGGETAGIP